MFSIGDLVLCECHYEDWYTDDGDKIQVPAPGKVYTIREVRYIASGVYALTFDELKNIRIDDGIGNFLEPCFESTCFRAIPEADLTELKQLLL